MNDPVQQETPAVDPPVAQVVSVHIGQLTLPAVQWECPSCKNPVIAPDKPLVEAVIAKRPVRVECHKCKALLELVMSPIIRSTALNAPGQNRHERRAASKLTLK